MNARFVTSVLCIYTYNGRRLNSNPPTPKRKMVNDASYAPTQSQTHDDIYIYIYILISLSAIFTTHISHFFEHFISLSRVYCFPCFSSRLSISLSLCFILYYVCFISLILSRIFPFFSSLYYCSPAFFLSLFDHLFTRSFFFIYFYVNSIVSCPLRSYSFISLSDCARILLIFRSTDSFARTLPDVPFFSTSPGSFLPYNPSTSLVSVDRVSSHLFTIILF